MKYFQRRNFVQIVINKNSANFIIEKLLLNSEDGRTRIAMVYDSIDGIFMCEAVQILFQVKLIGIIFHRAELFALPIMLTYNVVHHFAWLFESPYIGQNEVDFIG